MYIKVEEDLIKKVQAITCTDYECKGDLIPHESIIPLIKDLLIEIDRLEEKYEDLEKDMEENYRRIPVAEQYGVSDSDFI